MNEELEQKLIESIRQYGKTKGVRKIINYNRFLTICNETPDFKMKIDKILSEKQSEKLEDIFYIDQLVEHFNEQEIKNLRYLIETTEGRCIGCGTFSELNKKKYCKKCATNNALKFRK